MNPLHLSQDQLIDLFYGIAEPSAHLDECPACQARYAALTQRQALTRPLETPASFYHQQRRRILDRMAQPVRSPLSPVWVPAAVAALMAVGLVISRPMTTSKPRPQTNPSEIREVAFEDVDTGWFEDAYSDLQVSEPRALSPMRSLFVDGARKP